MYPETIPPILLRASCLTEHEVRSSGRFDRTKAEAILIEKGMPTDMSRGWKTKYGENARTEANWRTSEGTGLQLEHAETYVPSNDGVSGVK